MGSVFLRVWQYDVAVGREVDFERIDAADGDWARLFAASDGNLGTELYRCLGEPRRYITFDRFTSPEAWRRFVVEHGAEYAALDHTAEEITLSEQELATAAQP